jgi:hypothetical protein
MPEVVAAKTIDLLSLGGVTELAVASTTTVYGRSFPLPREASFSLEIQFDSAAAVDVKLELENGSSRPDTEGAVDTDYVEADGASDVATGITTETVHFIPVSPTVSPFARFRFTGQGANAASTKITRCKLHYIQ